MSYPGKIIKMIREKRGWSQIELSKRVGINNSVLSRIEAGKRAIEDHEMGKFADIFEVTTDQLHGRSKKTYLSKDTIDFLQDVDLLPIDELIKKHPQMSYKGEKISGSDLERALDLIQDLKKKLVE